MGVASVVASVLSVLASVLMVAGASLGCLAILEWLAFHSGPPRLTHDGVRWLVITRKTSLPWVLFLVVPGAGAAAQLLVLPLGALLVLIVGSYLSFRSRAELTADAQGLRIQRAGHAAFTASWAEITGIAAVGRGLSIRSTQGGFELAAPHARLGDVEQVARWLASAKWAGSARASEEGIPPELRRMVALSTARSGAPGDPPAS